MAGEPYTFFEKNQKFILEWTEQAEGSELENCFSLKVGDVPLTKLDFLRLDFKLTGHQVELFNGNISINSKGVCEGGFVWTIGTLNHKIAKAIDGEPAEDIKLMSLDSKAAIMDEALSVLSKVEKPQTGFRSLCFTFLSLDEKIS